MALLHAVGFEWGKDGEEGITKSSSTSYDTTIMRTGARSMRISGVTMGGSFNYWCRLPLATPLSEFYYQFGYRLEQMQSAAKGILAWRSGTTVLGGLRINTSNRLELYVGNFTIKAGESATALQPNRWYVVEVYVKIADSGGVLILRIDMNEEAAYSGDTKPGTETTVDNLLHGELYSGNSWIDDLIVHTPDGQINNSWPSGVKVVLLKPNGDGGTLQWTPNPSGTHYTTVDEVPPSGTDYLQAIEAGRVDELSLEDLPAEALSVKGVILQAWALKGSTVPPTRLALGLKLGGTDYYSADKDLGTSQGYIRELWEQIPGGGNLTVAGINNAGFLLKSRE